MTKHIKDEDDEPMEKEFNLSERRFVDGDDYNKYSYYEENVKEFIRLLKEGIHDFNETELGDIGRNEFIDKLAGDKLIEENK